MKRIQTTDVDLIKTYWRNPRKSEEAVGFVADSIKRFGFQVPIVVDAKNVIITGHTRYRAARQLGLKKVPVIVADLTEAKARQFRIADNKTSELAKWDLELLADELKELADLSEVRAIFGGPDWDSILNVENLQTGVTPESLNNATPEPPPTGPADNQIEVTCPHCGEENSFTLTS